ncbi:MAG: serine--tRNA ligase [Spirochaetes bacterium]|nr:serine--tRNA ligase [Spirochaetota bacterium]
MLDIRYISENMDKVKTMLEKRNQVKFFADVEDMIKKYQEKNKVQHESDSLRNQRNEKSKQIGKIKADGKDISKISEEVKKINEETKSLEQDLVQYNEKINKVLYYIPNMLDDIVPRGKDETFNKVIRAHGKKPEFKFKPKPHWDIAEENNIIDFKRGTKLAGSRFVLYNSRGAALERALINFMLDIQTKEHGYKEFIPPFMVNEKTMTGTGQLPKFKEDLFKIEGSDHYLIPTAEVPLTNIHSDEVLKEEDLPLYYTAYTPCFRSEAGSWGKDTRGLIRLHQFNKVELVKIVHPDNSEKELDSMVADAEKILQMLDIHYRIVALSSGDIGFSSSLTYDIEVWLPGVEAYREISSCSNCRDFQARRANIKFKSSKGKTEFVHTLNGSGLAIGRTLVAILENFQTIDGDFTIPEVLKKYL